MEPPAPWGAGARCFGADSSSWGAGLRKEAQAGAEARGLHCAGSTLQWRWMAEKLRLQPILFPGAAQRGAPDV